MTKKRKPITHVFMVVDKSGSMHPLQDDVIGGFNTYVNKLAEDTEHEYRITAILFDTSVRRHSEAKKPAEIAALDYRSYAPGGTTALYDAVGDAIYDAGRVTIKPADKVLVVIMTDGEENSSREYTTEAIKFRIQDREKQGWEFLYIGQGLDTWNQASGMGLRATSYLHTNSSKGATVGTYGGLASGTIAVAAGGSVIDTRREVLKETDGK
jgi:Mg-chelatase subunit ChlD